MIFINKNRGQAFSLLLIAVFLLTIQRWLVGVNNTLGLVLSLVVFAILLFHALQVPYTYKLSNIDKECRVIFCIFLICSTITALRGLCDLGFSVSSIAQAIVAPKAITPYFLPCLSLIAFSKINFKCLFDLSCVLCFCFIGILILDFDKLLYLNRIGLNALIGLNSRGYGVESYAFYSTMTSFIAPVIIFLWKSIVRSNTWKVACVNIGAALIASLIAGRRSSTFYYLLVFIAYYYVVLKNNAQAKFFAIIIAVMGLGILFSSGMLDFFTSRFDLDTRSGVVEHFYADMDTASWVVGRGAMGTYYDNHFIDSVEGGLRSEIETGYLNMILKGGCIYLSLYVLVLMISFYKGFFKSKNTLCKAAACMCLISALELIPYGIPITNFKYVCLWLGVGFCLNERVRLLTDEQIKLFTIA